MTTTPPEPAVVPADALVLDSYTVNPVTLFGGVAGAGQPAVLAVLRGATNTDGVPAEVSLLITPTGALDLADALDAAATAALDGRP